LGGNIQQGEPVLDPIHQIRLDAGWIIVTVETLQSTVPEAPDHAGATCNMSRDTLQAVLHRSRQGRQAVEAVRRETPAEEFDELR
jgi:hypothetical protein